MSIGSKSSSDSGFTYEETLAWLYDQLPMFQRDGPAKYRIDLSRTHALCDALGHPELKFPSIHVAGTNGKGSVCHGVAAALTAGGLKVGLHTSPHLWDPRERIRIDGKMISRARLIDFVAQHRDLWAELQPSFFELMFGLAMVTFAEEGVDVAVVETGMGGRLDSTSVVRPLVTSITSIGLDHTQFLGPDLRSIAAEKAGILKEGVPCVLGLMPPEARSVILQHSLRLGVEIYDADREPIRESEARWLALGRGLARKIISMLPTLQFDRDAASKMLDGLPKDWGLRGRWEWVGEHALVDCAHNVEGLRATMNKLNDIDRPLRILFASVSDKDLSLVWPLLPLAANYHFCAADMPRALDPFDLAALAQTKGLKGQAHGNVSEAVDAALKAQTGDELLVVLGSIFIAGPALEALGAPME